MNSLVLDASVVIKLFFQEDHSDAAERCVRQGRGLMAPDLIWAETANVIWKRCRRGELSKDDAAGIVAELLKMPLQIHASADLIPDALDLAVQYDRTVNDFLYLALAVKTRSILVSADKHLVHGLDGTPLAKHVIWIGR